MDTTNRTKVYVPLDTSACALGADQVASAITAEAVRTGEQVEVVRNGSRGMFWLEPMVEVSTPSGRIAYGPVEPEQVVSLMAAGMLQGSAEHPLYLGPPGEIPFFKRQQRLTFARVGIIDPLSLEDYRGHGGFAGLTKALAYTPQNIVDELKTSGLRGRGGAAFPTSIKWQTVLDAPGAQKYIACNADEGDSGTFADRMLMEGDPFCLIEGMIIAGLAVGATQGFIYLREEYPQAQKVLSQAIGLAEQAGYLGDNICGSDKSFHLELRLGAGAYICGEETSMLESLEGKRGEVRAKPPLPAIEGLFAQPTVVNNVISLATVPIILAKGGEFYRDYGCGRSRGTQPFQLAGNLKYSGLLELAFGPTLREVLEDFGGGTRTGKPMAAVQVGGPLGAYLPPSQWDTSLDYEAFAEIDGVLGHGGIVAFDNSVNMMEQARFSMEFCALESCGKCTPCRIGATRGTELLDKMQQGGASEEQVALLRDLCETMVDGSLCAMGGMTPFPVVSALNHFAEDFVQGDKASSEGVAQASN